MGWCGVDWINVAHDRDKWQVVVDMIGTSGRLLWT
jgi:hypothetical protein